MPTRDLTQTPTDAADVGPDDLLHSRYRRSPPVELFDAWVYNAVGIERGLASGRRPCPAGRFRRAADSTTIWRFALRNGDARTRQVMTSGARLISARAPAADEALPRVRLGRGRAT